MLWILNSIRSWDNKLIPACRWILALSQLCLKVYILYVSGRLWISKRWETIFKSKLIWLSIIYDIFYHLTMLYFKLSIKRYQNLDNDNFVFSLKVETCKFPISTLYFSSSLNAEPPIVAFNIRGCEIKFAKQKLLKTNNQHQHLIPTCYSNLKSTVSIFLFLKLLWLIE